MKKNVKGFIGLFTGIAAFILILAAIFVPANPISGSALALHGSANVIMALVGGLLGIVAIVFGVMSRKDADKKGPRKAGVIIGVFAIIFALLASAVCSLTKEIADYANGKPNSVLSQMDETQRKDIDKTIDMIRQEYPAEK